MRYAYLVNAEFFLKRYWAARIWVCASVVLPAVFGWFLALAIPPHYLTYVEVYVRRTSPVSVPSSLFTYEGYYGQQTAKDATDTVLGFLKGYEIWRLVARERGMGEDLSSIHSISRNVKARKVATNLLLISVKSPSAAESQSLTSDMVAALNKQITAVFDQGDAAIETVVLGSSPFPSEKVVQSPLLWAVVFSLIGLISFSGLFLLYTSFVYLR